MGRSGSGGPGVRSGHDGQSMADSVCADRKKDALRAGGSGRQRLSRDVARLGKHHKVWFLDGQELQRDPGKSWSVHHRALEDVGRSWDL